MDRSFLSDLCFQLWRVYAPILDYLWRCSIEAMNLSVLYHGRDLEREAVTAELVLRE